ncbi:hypothetical protein FFWV33_16405 [Flavobacterium faecale]|uniref:Uncharacterized protein n=1 Tax=Flavobacterium faecale TaxID=1355330 RepID=A0A2S1LGW3_9FLAO|nr:hypothetical protein FFWV33_16405 [Flavobacterium faecale]
MVGKVFLKKLVEPLQKKVISTQRFLLFFLKRFELNDRIFFILFILVDFFFSKAKVIITILNFKLFKLNNLYILI